MSKKSCPLLQNIYCTSFIKKTWIRIYFFMQTILFQIITEKIHFYIASSTHSLWRKKSDPASKKQLQIKKREKNNTVSFNSDPDLVAKKCLGEVKLVEKKFLFPICQKRLDQIYRVTSWADSILFVQEVVTHFI